MGKQTAIPFPNKAPQASVLEDRLLRLEAVSDMTTLGRTEIYERIKTGAFPKPVQLGPASVAWRLSAIQNWISDLQERTPEAKQK